MVLMVESICGQGFAYAYEVEEDWTKSLVKLDKKKTTYETTVTSEANQNQPTQPDPVPFIVVLACSTG
jgi:hypothetical protein